MYIHIGNNFLIKKDEIIGVFDLDSTTISKRTRDFLSNSEKKGEVISITYELPKTFVVCSKKRGENLIYLSQLSSSTLLKRSEYIDSF